MKKHWNGETAAEEIAKNNPCQECDSTNVEAYPVVTNWRGWQVECLNCGNVDEYDLLETPAEHRSV